MPEDRSDTRTNSEETAGVGGSVSNRDTEGRGIALRCRVRILAAAPVRPRNVRGCSTAGRHTGAPSAPSTRALGIPRERLGRGWSRPIKATEFPSLPCLGTPSKGSRPLYEGETRGLSRNQSARSTGKTGEVYKSSGCCSAPG